MERDFGQRRLDEHCLGILGGMGPQATQVFYQRILDRTDANRDQEHIRALILSDTAIPDRTAAILSGRTATVRDRLVTDAKLLENAGCTLLAVPCNTSHYFAEDIQGAVHIPLLHMPRLAVARARELGHKKLAVLATRGTVKTGIYQRELDGVDLACWAPDEGIQSLVDAIIYDQIKAGEQGSRTDFAAIDKAIRKAGCDGAILGCTELSVYRAYHGLPEFYIDAMEVLAEGAITACGKRLREV